MVGRRRTLSWASVLLLLLALGSFAGAGSVWAEDASSVAAPVTTLGPSGVKPVSTETRVSEIVEIPPNALPGGETVEARASEECHRQKVTMSYADASDKIYLKFTGIKFWCYDGQRVTRAGMNVEPWIRPDSRYGPGQDGYRFVGSGLKRSDRFLAYNGHRNGAHESVRIGRFEYRVRGFPKAAQVLNPYISRTGRYDGTCVGPKPKDISPKVTAVKPTGGAKGVSPSANVEAVFSREMRARTIDGGTLQLVKRGAFDPVQGSIRYDAAKRKAVLDPARRLSAGTYTATVSSGPFGALTSEGDPLIASRTWSFTVTR